MVGFTEIGQVTAAPGAHRHDSGEVSAWHPVATRANVNPHYTDSSGLGPNRNAVPAVNNRLARVVCRVLEHGVRTVRVEWRNVYTQVADPGEVAGPNPVTLRASIEYPAGAWRQVNGSTTWSSTTAYNPGDQVLHQQARFVAVETAAAGTTPTGDLAGPWRQVQVLPVSWPGQDADRRVTVQPGAGVVSDPIEIGQDGLGLMAGYPIAVTLLASTVVAGGAIVAGADSLPTDFVVDYPSAPDPATDLVDAPVTTETSLAAGTPMPLPTMLAGCSSDPTTVVALGDSLFHGLYDTAIDNDHGGFISRGLRATQHVHVSVSGARADFYTVPGQVSSWRRELVDRFPVVLTDLGGNDAVLGDGTTSIASNLAMVQQRQSILWRGLAQRCPNVWATVMTPWTASTDGWATVANQSIANNIMGGTNGLDGVWAQLRSWMADGAPLTLYGRTVRAGDGEHPLAGIVDLSYAVTDAASGWRWKAGLTSDGMHPNPAGHRLLADALRPYLPALTHSGRMSDVPSGSFEGHWTAPVGAGEGMAVSGSAMVTNFTRTLVEGVGCTMNNGVFTPMVGGSWRFEFTGQFAGGSSAMRAVFLRELATNAWGNVGQQAAVSDSPTSGAVLRLKRRQQVGMYVANWSGATKLNMWNDGGTQFRATWLGP